MLVPKEIIAAAALHAGSSVQSVSMATGVDQRVLNLKVTEWLKNGTIRGTASPMHGVEPLSGSVDVQTRYLEKLAELLHIELRRPDLELGELVELAELASVTLGEDESRWPAIAEAIAKSLG